jgi:hypothetical protein
MVESDRNDAICGQRRVRIAKEGKTPIAATVPELEPRDGDSNG